MFWRYGYGYSRPAYGKACRMAKRWRITKRLRVYLEQGLTMLGIGRLQRLYLNLKAKDYASLDWSWQRCRRAFLKKVGKVCVICNTKKAIQVHHVKPRHLFPELSLVNTNLIALCRDCHFHIGHLCSYFTYNLNIVMVAWFVRNNSVKKKNEAA